MERRVVGLLHSPWRSDPERLKASRSPADWYRYAVWFKANPRDADYMRELFVERYAEGTLVDVNREARWGEAVARADTVVLLYPDATGLGFRPLERQVLRAKKNWAAVRALNGRRRDFLLTPSSLAALRLRRTLERTMLAELLFLPVFLCVTPLLLVADLLRGRR